MGKGKKRERDIAADEHRFTQMGKEGNDGRGKSLTTGHPDQTDKKERGLLQQSTRIYR